MACFTLVRQTGHRFINSHQKPKALAITYCAAFEKGGMSCKEARVQSCPAHEKSLGEKNACARERAGRLAKWIPMFSICFSVLPNHSYTVLGKTIQFLWACFCDVEIIKNDFCLQSFVSFVYMNSKLFKTGAVSQLDIFAVVSMDGFQSRMWPLGTMVLQK